LPSPRTLKLTLAKIPFLTGINKPILDLLKLEVDKMPELDRTITLVFDEIALTPGLQYEAHKQSICGFQDLGELGRSHDFANHSLVFMIRGVRKSFKQVIAYYFASHSVSANNLKILLVQAIEQLQNIGFNVVATVCDQMKCNQKALSDLCLENKDTPTPYHFIVSGKPICVIYDVPHLLKNTRNALMSGDIRFEGLKTAKFQYIKDTFDFDQQRTYKMLPKLKEQYFNSNDSFIKMKVKVAASQLSHSVASAIETCVSKGQLPAEAIFTAEFVSNIDSLFDSLNGSQRFSPDGKMYRCALSEKSPHLDLWSKMLTQLSHWQIYDTKGGTNKTNRFSFIKGWQTTIRSIIFIWNNLRSQGLQYLNLKSFNQDPLENLFGQIRQHGITNTHPTCHQFVSALKTIVVNSLSSPVSNGNCENDNCQSLANFTKFLTSDYSTDGNSDQSDDSHSETVNEELLNLDFLNTENQASAYVAGYILKSISIPECHACKTNLFSENISNMHLFTSFKEYSENKKLCYASEKVVELVNKAHHFLYLFLDKNGHKTNIETDFKNQFYDRLKVEFCPTHNCEEQIIDKIIRLDIYKYIKDKLPKRSYSSGHTEKVKKFKQSKVQ